MSLECVFQMVYWASLVHRVGCPEKPSLYLLSFFAASDTSSCSAHSGLWPEGMDQQEEVPDLV